MYNNLKLRVGALVLGVTLAVAGSAFTTDKRTTNDPVYGRTSPQGDWILVTSTTEQQRSCAASEDVCKAAFSSDPNEPGAVMTEVIEDNGIYSLLPAK